MNDSYHFLTRWRVAGTVAEVRAVLSDAASLPRWWPSVYLGVDLLEGGGANGVGRVVAVHTKGWLPYTLRWTPRIIEPISDSGFALQAGGDLQGAGHWTFRQDGPEVAITYDWRVTVTKPLLRRLSWGLKPGLAANHRWAMARGEESLGLEIRRRRATSDAERARVPPPPPATFQTLHRLTQRRHRARHTGSRGHR